MTQEDKQLILKDLCARLPYGVKVQFHLPNYSTNCFDDKIGEVFEIGNAFTHVHCDGIDYLPNTNRIKPYLRPLSSMTEKEQHEYDNLCMDNLALPKFHLYYPMRWHTMDYLHVDWLNAHHFDYRGLIPMGLALEAPEGVYKTE